LLPLTAFFHILRCAVARRHLNLESSFDKLANTYYFIFIMSRNPRQTVTMRDIARESGLSQPTVSLVLNGRCGSVRICDKTRRHVLDTACRLGYTKNALATALKTGKSKIIGVVCLLGSYHVPGLLGAFLESLQKQGYLMKLFGIVSERDEEFESAVRQFSEQCVDGVVCISLKCRHFAIMRKLDAAGIPLLCLDFQQEVEGVAVVDSADFEGMHEMTSYLIKCGHRRIGHVSNYDPWNRDAILDGAVIRRQGYFAAMHDAGLAVDEHSLCLVSPLSAIDPADIAVLDKFHEEYAPTALACFSDVTALKVLQWAYTRGIKIPDDLSVTGFAGLSESALAAPALTTMAQPFAEMGTYAAESLIGMICGKNFRRRKFSSTLIERDSVKKIDHQHLEDQAKSKGAAS